MYRSTDETVNGPATCIALTQGAAPLRQIMCKPVEDHYDRNIMERGRWGILF